MIETHPMINAYQLEKASIKGREIQILVLEDFAQFGIGRQHTADSRYEIHQ